MTWILPIAGAVCVLSLAAGLARRKFPRAPATATAAIIVGYVILLAVVPGLASEAHAGSYTSGWSEIWYRHRSTGVFLAFLLTYSFAGWFALLQVALVWEGVWLSTQKLPHFERRFILMLVFYLFTLAPTTAFALFVIGLLSGGGD